MRRFFATSILLIILSCCTVMLLPSEVASNPITVFPYAHETGGLFLGNNVSMPESNVNIVLDPFGEGLFNLRSVFTLTSEINQTVLTAFAYPQEWEYLSGDPQSMDCEFNIHLEHEQVDFQIMTFEQIIEEFNSQDEWNMTDWIWIEDHHFASFNVSFIRNSPVTLEVYGYSSLIIPVGGDYTFRYCVGSANSWSGATHENIRIDVMGINSRETRFGDEVIVWEFDGFFPETGLNVIQNQTCTSAVWELYLEESNFEINHVGFSGLYYSYWDPILPRILEITILASLAIVIIVVGLRAAKRRSAT